MGSPILDDRERLVLLAAAYAELLAHARAAVAAAERGESDPIGYVRDVLAGHGQLPPVGAQPARLLSAPTAGGYLRSRAPACRYERIFPGRPQAVGDVRRFVAACLTDAPRRDEAVLCASELAGNAVRHSASGLDDGKFTVRVVYGGRAWVRIEVADAGGRPDPEHHDDIEGGRGLAIIGALSRCGATAVNVDGHTGRLAWCELDWPTDH